MIGAIVKTDFDFADDIALVSNLSDQARKLLHSVETECRKVGLRLNAKKTEVIAFKVSKGPIQPQIG
jgi:ribosome-interacting GTPase 1